MAEHVTSKIIFDYLSEALTPAEKGAFEAHVPGCAECAAALEQRRGFLSAVQTALSLPPRLTDLELLNKVRAEHERRVATGELDEPGFRLLRFLGYGFAFALGALCLYLAYALFAPNQRGMLAAPLPPNAQVGPPDGGER